MLPVSETGTALPRCYPVRNDRFSPTMERRDASGAAYRRRGNADPRGYGPHMRAMGRPSLRGEAILPVRTAIGEPVRDLISIHPGCVRPSRHQPTTGLPLVLW